MSFWTQNIEPMIKNSLIHCFGGLRNPTFDSEAHFSSLIHGSNNKVETEPLMIISLMFHYQAFTSQVNFSMCIMTPEVVVTKLRAGSKNGHFNCQFPTCCFKKERKKTTVMSFWLWPLISLEKITNLILYIIIKN